MGMRGVCERVCEREGMRGVCERVRGVCEGV